MKTEELKILKKKVEKLQTKREEVLTLQEEIALLEKSEVVKKYLNLLDLLDKKTTGRNANIDKITDEEIINIALRETKITPDEEIYVYLGTYKYNNELDIVHSLSDIPISRTNKYADYVLYQNLESKYYDSFKVPYKSAEEFENTHKVIIPKNVVSRKKYFYKLQLEYFETMILESPEEAKQKIKKLLEK